MDPASTDLFDDHPRPDPALRAARLSPQLRHHQFDELRGRTGGAEGTGLAPHWATFFSHLGHEGFDGLNHRANALARQIRDNGVSYNVYADTSGPQRPWSLDLFPLILPPAAWQQIEAGVVQRVRLLERVMADVYGPQRFLRQGLLPAALVQGHPGYLRPMHGVQAVGGTWLPLVAFDLARGPDGHWWVVSQRTQAPSGLGYLLENRLSISRQFPQAFESMQVQHLASTYRALVDNLKRMSPAGADSHIALLTPGPYNETYFEHAYLARYLGLTLVEGNDLTVRDQHVYLKTLSGLQPVHGLLKRLDDEFLDPLELRPDSTLGIPGLLQAIRAGNVLVANAPGSGFLESGALLGFLPALAQECLGEELALPALPTWWCGERAALDTVLPKLAECVIKPTYPNARGNTEAVLCSRLSRNALDQWSGRLLREGELHTVQKFLDLSQTPTWRDDRIVPRPALLRVFAVADGPDSWRVLPGGLTRLASNTAGMASMQRGGSSADTWVLTEGDVDRTTLLTPNGTPAVQLQRRRVITSRAAENLYWLGRYTERTENNIRLARLTLDSLNGQDPCSDALLTWLGDLAQQNALVLPDVPSALQARRVFERSLIASLGGRDHATSVGASLRALRLAAASVRERLAQENWNLITRVEEEFAHRCKRLSTHGEYTAAEAMRVLEAASTELAAITGAQTDRMTRDDGWRLLSIGRHIERLCFLAPALGSCFETGAVHDNGGFEALIALFDSTITFHAQYQLSHEIAALLDLLVLDRDNPRSLGWVLQTLQGRLDKLAGNLGEAVEPLSSWLPLPGQWQLDALCSQDETGQHAALLELLGATTQAAWRVSDTISLRYFTHTAGLGQSLEI